MGASQEFEYQGHGGKLVGRVWPNEEQARYVALLCHGYGEHLGRYEWVAEQLQRDGAAVYAVDHLGHGKSEGEPVLVADFEPVVDDFHALAQRAVAEVPGVPVVLIGHSMGGMLAARYAQRYAADPQLACVVLSGPAIGRLDFVGALLGMDPIPEVPLDPAQLSRDAAVGEAYAADPLVWHGAFKRPTLEAFKATIAAINEGGRLSVPTLWVHGAGDQIVPIDGAEEGWAAIAPESEADSGAKRYEGAQHEIFNETNKDEVMADVLGFVNEHVR